MDLHPELSDLVRQIDANTANAQKLVESLSNQQFNQRPPSGGWSVAECLAHVNAVNGLDLPVFARVIEASQQKGLFDAGPYRYGWLSRWFVRNLDAPAKRKFKAPEIYKPAANLSLDKVAPEYLKQQERLAQLVKRANGLDLARIKVPSPVTKWLKFPLGMRFALITAHDRRHLAQAWRVRESMNGRG